jgi:hypothetical protein
VRQKRIGPSPYFTVRSYQPCRLLRRLSGRKNKNEGLDPDIDPGEVGLFLGIIEGLVFVNLATRGQGPERFGDRHEIRWGLLDFRGESQGGRNLGRGLILAGGGELVWGSLARGKNGKACRFRGQVRLGPGQAPGGLREAGGRLLLCLPGLPKNWIASEKCGQLLGSSVLLELLDIGQGFFRGLDPGGA